MSYYNGKGYSRRSMGDIIDIDWADRKLGKSCLTDKAGRKKFGPERWKRLQRRLTSINGAPTLADLKGIAGFHALHADLDGHYVLALDGPYRLVFRPADPTPRRPDGSVDVEAVTAVTITEVADYHG